MFIASFISYITLNKGLLPKSKRPCKHLMYIEIIQELFWMSNLIWSTCTVPLGQAPSQSALITALQWNLKVGNIFPRVRKILIKMWTLGTLLSQGFNFSLHNNCSTCHLISILNLPNYLFILLKGENSLNSAFLWRFVSIRETLLICTSLICCPFEFI